MKDGNKEEELVVSQTELKSLLSKRFPENMAKTNNIQFQAIVAYYLYSLSVVLLYYDS